jgi:hypothetical protein
MRIMNSQSSVAVLGIALMAIVVMGIPLRAQEDTVDAAPPQIFKLEAYDAAAQSVQLLQTREVLVPSVFAELDKEGRTVEKIAFLVQNVASVQTFSTKDMRALSLQGEALKTADALSKLKKGQPLLTVSSGKRVPKAFWPLFRDDVVVLELPPAMPPMFPGAAKAP